MSIQYIKLLVAYESLKIWNLMRLFFYSYRYLYVVKRFGSGFAASTYWTHF